jgi:helicase
MDSFIPEVTVSSALNLALDTMQKKKQALIFANTKQSAEKQAEDIAKKSEIKDILLDDIAEKILKALQKPTRQCQRLAFCIRKGIAFHHAGLTQKQRALVEDHFRSGEIKIICSTPSLAMGVDLPAFRSILKDMRRYGRRGLQYIPVLEYMQMAGRAGRPKFDTEGQAIILASSEAEAEKLRDMYIYGKPEEIYSKLAVEPVLRTYLLSLIATDFVSTRKQIIDFFKKTFWAHQYKDIKRLELIIDRMLALLVEYEFLISSADEFSSADELEDVKYRATILGKRVAELYLDPLTAHGFVDALRRATGVYILPFSFLHLVANTSELEPLLRVKMKEYDKIMDEYAKFTGHLVTLEPSAFDSDYDRYLNSVKTALFFNDWIEEFDDEQLLEKYDVRPGETRTKLDLADWLLYCLVEIARLQGFLPLAAEASKLRFRMKYGVREELLPLLKLRHIGRVRARALFRNGFKDVGALKKMDTGKLGAIIGSRKVAEDIKEQLGEKVERVSPRKRKGQMSVEKY